MLHNMLGCTKQLARHVHSASSLHVNPMALIRITAHNHVDQQLTSVKTIAAKLFMPYLSQYLSLS